MGLVLMALAGAGAGAAQNNAAPTPGDLQRQIAPEQPSALPQLQAKPPRIENPTAPATGAKMVTVTRWELQGNKILSTAQLELALAPFTGVPVSMVQLNEASALVQQTYEEAGYLARVVLPKQDVTDGIVRLQILEAQLSRIVLDPDATSRVNMQRVQRVITQQHPMGQALSSKQLDRALLLADDLPGVSLAGMLQAGSAEGSTDLLLKTTEEPPHAIDVSMDNTGARAVGADKLNLAANFVSPFGGAETFSFQGQRSEGSQYARAAMGLPLGYSGLRASAFASLLDYQVVAPEFKDSRLTGRSKTYGVDLNYPLLRTRQANIFATAQLEERTYNAWAADVINPDGWYKINALQYGLNANAFDTFGGGGASSLGLQIIRGEVRGDAEGFTPSREVFYSKLRLNASRQQTLADNMTLYAAVQAQYTPEAKLDSAENMSLGGSAGVRAYPSGEASGPIGQLVNIEVRWRISPEWLLTPFIDWGKVEKRDNTAGGPEAYELSGAGIGLNWSGPNGWNANLIYARRLGDNPHPKVTESNQILDQDGSRTIDRYWFTLKRTF